MFKLKLYFTFIFILAFSSLMLAQENIIKGKMILKGIWKEMDIEYVKGEVAVILKKGSAKSDIQEYLNRYNAIVIREFDQLNWGLLELPKSFDIFSFIKELSMSEHVQSAEPNMIDHLQYETNDPYFQNGFQWALKNTGQDLNYFFLHHTL